jgi:hypothetical protein
MSCEQMTGVLFILKGVEGLTYDKLASHLGKCSELQLKEL